MKSAGPLLSKSQCDLLEVLCAAALELPASERAAHVLQTCADPVVRREALSLLGQMGTVDEEGFLQGVASLPPLPAEMESDLPADDSAWLPNQIAGYRIVRRIGAGGMGVVWEAEQESPRRLVAIKTIRPAFATPGLLKRFKLEAQILGQLQHPGIAQIHEFGMTKVNGSALPFFTMEFIEGRDLSTYLAEENPSRAARLQLFLRICDAIAFAHLRDVIHRDIKPNNILIDATGRPKILDFGIARMMDSDPAAATLVTETGQVQGTLPYMSPEQARGDSSKIDLRSDVYSLAVILYEMLTGRLPLDIGQAPLHEAVRKICDDIPRRPSTIARVLRGDLETITLKALAKDPRRRYQNVDALGDDIRRHLANQPILGRPPSAIYQVRKLVARHKALFVFLTSLFAVVLGFGVWMSVLYARADELRMTAVANEQNAINEAQRARLAESAHREAREQAEQARDELRIVVGFQQSMLSGIEPQQWGQSILADLTEGVRKALFVDEDSRQEAAARLATFEQLAGMVNATDLALELLDDHLLARAVETLTRDFSDQPLVEAALRQAIGETYRALGLYEQAHAQFKRALAVRRQLSGNDHPDTFQTLASMGAVLKDMGQYTEAASFQREALDGRRRILGNSDPDTLSSIDDMGLLLHQMGRLDDAETYYREALDGRLRVLGDDHADTVSSQNNLGGLLMSREKNDEALLLLRAALDGYRRIYGDDHQHTLIARFNLSHLHKMMGKQGDAVRQAREALAGFQRVLGDDHPFTLAAMGHLGLLLREAGYLDEARGYLAEVLERKRRVLGDDHPSTQNSISDMGLILESTGDLAAAEPYYRESLAGTRRSLGNDHPHTLSGVANLAHLLHLLGKSEESETLLGEALTGCRRVLGDDHPQTLQAIYDMGVWMRQAGRMQQARALGAEAVAGARRRYPRALGPFLAGYGITLIASEDYAAAESALREAVQILETQYSDAHHRTIEVRRTLVSLYTVWSEVEPNAGHEAQAAKYRTLLPEQNRD